MDTRDYPLIRADIELVTACNLHCLHCMVETNRGVRSLGYSQWMSVLQTLKAQGVVIISLTGGEPLLHPEFCRIAEGAAALGLSLIVFTNGMLLRQENVKVLSALPIQWSVSLDGATAATHDVMRGKSGAFEEAIAGTRLLAREGCSLRIESVITKINVTEISKIARLAADLGATRYSASALRLCRRSWLNKAQLWVDRFTMAAARSELGAVAEKLSGVLAVELPSTPLQKPDGKLPWQKMYICTAGAAKLGILADGSVVPCLLLSEMVLGNVLQTDIPDMLLNPVLRELRSIPERVDCGTCEAQEMCGRGCRAAALHTTGDLSARDPSCYGWYPS